MNEKEARAHIKNIEIPNTIDDSLWLRVFSEGYLAAIEGEEVGELLALLRAITDEVDIDSLYCSLVLGRKTLKKWDAMLENENRILIT
jgi:selenophosphate synthetase-related protein